MAFADPQSVTINGVANSLPLVEAEKNKSTYSNADESVKLIISHQQSGTRTRRLVALEQRVIATSPLTSTNDYRTAKVNIVIDQPEYGFSVTTLDYLVQALKAWLTTANDTKVLGGEH